MYTVGCGHELPTLTNSADNIVGTAGNDKIGGTNSAAGVQFSAADTIDGGAGTDTLVLDLNAAYAGGATIKNVEKISLTQGGATFVATGIAGLTDIEFNAGVASTGTGFSGVGSLANVQVTNRAVNTLVTYTDAAVAGSSDAVSLTFNNATAGITQLDSATALGAGLETVNVVSTGSSNTVQFASNDSTIKKMTVTGDTNLSLTLLGAGAGVGATGADQTTNVTTIDATGYKGNLTLAGLGAANHTVTGGDGNDTFNFGVNFNANDSVDGGAGTDTLRITTSGAQTAITAAQWAKVKNVEAVTFDLAGGNDLVQDASLLTGATTFNVVGTAAASEDFTLNKVTTKTTTIGVLANGQAAESLTVTLADATALDDSLTLKLGATSGAQATQNVTLTTLNDVTGLETLNIQALSSSTGGAAHVITTSNITGKLAISGDANLTIGAAANTTQIDATSLTGTLTVGSGTAYAVANGTIQGGSGVNTLTAGANAQTLIGGAAADVLTGGAGADTLKGNGGANQFKYTNNGDSFGTAIDRIMDFVAGTDKIVIDATNDGSDFFSTGTADTLNLTTATTVTLAAAQTIATAANLAAVYGGITAIAASTAANVSGVVVTVSAGDAAGTYLYINDGAGAVASTDDMLINITGITGTLTANDFLFV